MVTVRDQIEKQFMDAQDFTLRSVRAWNELLMTSADMAFDVVLKNWNYNRSFRNSVDQAVEDALDMQHQLTSEMMQVWQGYSSNVQQIIERAVDQE